MAHILARPQAVCGRCHMLLPVLAIRRRCQPFGDGHRHHPPLAPCRAIACCHKRSTFAQQYQGRHLRPRLEARRPKLSALLKGVLRAGRCTRREPARTSNVEHLRKIAGLDGEPAGSRLTGESVCLLSWLLALDLTEQKAAMARRMGVMYIPVGTTKFGVATTTLAGAGEGMLQQVEEVHFVRHVLPSGSCAFLADVGRRGRCDLYWDGTAPGNPPCAKPSTTGKADPACCTSCSDPSRRTKVFDTTTGTGNQTHLSLAGTSVVSDTQRVDAKIAAKGGVPANAVKHWCVSPRYRQAAPMRSLRVGHGQNATC